eukprot:scaffold5954_cov40-Prasinocladus_malaysianus.AAC.1
MPLLLARLRLRLDWRNTVSASRAPHRHAPAARCANRRPPRGNQMNDCSREALEGYDGFCCKVMSAHLIWTDEVPECLRKGEESKREVP